MLLMEFNHDITLKPPKLPFLNFKAVYAWLVVVLTLSDGEILQTAGLDALVMVKCAALGIQLLVPMCLLVTSTLAPIHRAGTNLEVTNLDFDVLMTYTIANLKQGSPLMWVHLVLTYVVVGYAMLLLWRHYKQYLVARQHYLLRGEDPNYWQQLVEDASPEKTPPPSFPQVIQQLQQRQQEEGSTTRRRPRRTGTRNSVLDDQHRLRSPSMSSRGSNPALAAPARYPSSIREDKVVASDQPAGGREKIPREEPLGNEGTENIAEEPGVSGTTGQSSQSAGPNVLAGGCSDALSETSTDSYARVADKLQYYLADPLQGLYTSAESLLYRAGLAYVGQVGRPADSITGDNKMKSRSELLGKSKTLKSASRQPSNYLPACTGGEGGSLDTAQHNSSDAIGTRLFFDSVNSRGSATTSSPEEDVRSQDQPPPLQVVTRKGPDVSCRAMAFRWWKDIPADILPSNLRTNISEKWLARPSVRHIKMVNTIDRLGRRIHVQAQNYAVLVTDVDQSLFPELDRPKDSLAHRLMLLLNNNSSMKTTLEPTWFRTYPAWLVNCVRWIAGRPARTSNLARIPQATSSPLTNPYSTPLTEGAASGTGALVVPLPHRPLIPSKNECSQSQAPGDSDTSPRVILNHFDIEEGLGHLQAQLAYKGVNIKCWQPRRRKQQQVARGSKAGLPFDTRDAPNYNAVVRMRDEWDNLAESDRLAQSKLHPELEGLHGWALVREAVRHGFVQELLLSEQYSIVTATFKRLFPDTFDRAIPVIRHFKVEMSLHEKDLLELNLQRAMLKEMRTGQIAMERETCCGPRVNIVEARQEAIEKLDERIVKERSAALQHSHTHSWFVFFKTQEAAVCAQSVVIHAEDNTKFQVHPAPGPDEVNWPHLWLNRAQRDVRSMLILPLMWLVVLLPVAAIMGALSQVDFFLCTKRRRNIRLDWFCSPSTPFFSFVRRLVTGWLPTVLLQLYQLMALPRLIFIVAQSEGGHYSLSGLDRRIGAIYFYWDVCNVFLGGVLGTGAIQQMFKFVETPDQVFNILGGAIPGSANFFLQYIALRCLLIMPLKFMLPHGNVWMNWARFIFCCPCCCSCCHTEQDNAMMFFPKSIRYGLEIGIMLLSFLIVISFSIIAPLVLPWGVMYFLLAWVFWRYAVLYIFTRKYESGGQMWPMVFNRMCFILGTFVIFNFSVLLVKKAFIQATVLICTLPWMIYKFYSFCRLRFELGVDGVPLELAHLAPVAHVDPLMYIPRPLREGASGWRPEWMKVWEGWGMPAYPIKP